jgi:hypothetical protein
VIARLTAYRIPPDGAQQLTDEIVALARASWPVRRTARRVELFCVDTLGETGLSVVVGDDRTVRPVIDVSRPSGGEPQEYDGRLLQVGPPKRSGVVAALYARVVHCDARALDDLTFDGNGPPASPEVWTRGLLVSSDRGDVAAFAVATDRAALEESLAAFDAVATRVEDYDDVAYHFFEHRD